MCPLQVGWCMKILIDTVSLKTMLILILSLEFVDIEHGY